MSPRDPKRDSEEAVAPQNETDQDGNATPGPSQVVPEIPPTPNHTDSPNDSDKEFKPHWFKILEAVAALAIIVYAIFSGLQWYIMQSSMKLDQRAWLGTTANIKGVLEVGKPIFLSVGIRNTGKTPAKNVIPSLSYQTVIKNDPFIFPTPPPDEPGITSQGLISMLLS